MHVVEDFETDKVFVFLILPLCILGGYTRLADTIDHVAVDHRVIVYRPNQLFVARLKEKERNLLCTRADHASSIFLLGGPL
jgi:hypothetical protein